MDNLGARQTRTRPEPNRSALRSILSGTKNKMATDISRASNNQISRLIEEYHLKVYTKKSQGKDSSTEQNYLDSMYAERSNRIANGKWG